MTVELGVLLSEYRYRRLLAGEFDAWRSLALEQEARFGVRKRFVSARSVDSEADQVPALAATPSGWEELLSPLPRLWYNLLPRPLPAESRTLRSLNGDPRMLVFNETNRWDRGMVADMLTSVPAARPLVMTTQPFMPQVLETAETGLYLLAPSRRPLREAAWLLEWPGAGEVTYTNIREGSRGQISPADLAELVPAGCRWLSRLSGHPVGPKGPAEWRLYTHRDLTGGWTVAGAVAKRDLLRTGGQRERCWPLGEALRSTFGTAGPDFEIALHGAALTVMEALCWYLPGVVHCAVDFWIDRTGRLSLADLAGGYRLDWLKRVGDDLAIQRLEDHPVRFARTLVESGVDKLDVDFNRTGQRRRGGSAPARGME